MSKDKVNEELPEVESQEGEEATEERRRMDPEIRCLGEIMRTLDKLEVPARERIVAFISSRYKEGK